MLRKIIILILSPLFNFLQSCISPLGNSIDEKVSDSYYYSKSGEDEVVFSPMGNWFELGKTKFKAHAKTFRPLANDIGKDEKFIYFGYEIQPHVDHSTFRIKGDIIMDKNHVYHRSTDYNYRLLTVEDADPKTFQYLHPDNDRYNSWAKDRAHYFLYHEKANVDYTTFTFLSQELAYDKDKVYFTEGKELIVKDTVRGEIKRVHDNYFFMGNTLFVVTTQLIFSKFNFEKIHQFSIKDQYCIIVNDTIIVNGALYPNSSIDIASFETYPDWNYIYARDKQHVYYEAIVINGADVETFEVLGYHYAKDKENVYFHESRVEGADAKAFYIDSRERITPTDGKHIYWEGKKVDPKEWNRK